MYEFTYLNLLVLNAVLHGSMYNCSTYFYVNHMDMNLLLNPHYNFNSSTHRHKEILILLIATLLMLSKTAQSQWNFETETNGNIGLSTLLNFPINYNDTTCQFTFSVNNNGSQDDVVIANSLGCGNTHWVIMDQYKYPISSGFNFNFYESGYGTAQLIDLGSCSTLTDNPILRDSPSLILGSEIFQINPFYKHQIFVENGETYFQFRSANADIYCTNGELYDLAFVLIFAGGFE